MQTLNFKEITLVNNKYYYPTLQTVISDLIIIIFLNDYY